MRLEKYIIQPNFKGNLDEMVYHGNIGFEELVRFYQKANDKQTEEMEELVKNSDWDGFKRLIQKVLNVKLK